LGLLVIFGTLVVAILGAVFAVLVWLNAFDGRPRDRTIWGIFVMALGPIGVVVAVVLLVRRRRITQQIEEQQWMAVAIFPGSFLILWLLAILAYATVSETAAPIISHTPTFVVRFDPTGRPGFNTEGVFGSSDEQRSERFSNDAAVGTVSVKYRTKSAEATENAVAFEGAIKQAGGNRVELRGELVLTQKVRMRVEGLQNATLTINDEPRESPVTLEPGQYRIVIQGNSRG